MAKMEVESEVTGNVWKIFVEEGSKVTSGDVVMILESMKMEIPVEALRTARSLKFWFKKRIRLRRSSRRRDRRQLKVNKVAWDSEVKELKGGAT